LHDKNNDFKRFFEWCRIREDIENEYRLHPVEQNGSETQNFLYRDPQLEAVRKAITRLTGFSDMRIRRNPPRMEILKDDQRLDVTQLSDGEKCFLALVGDIARRLALANLKLDDPLQGTAVVMIDEVELHLHPEWQHRIIPGLLETFPNCQFILSTHSPQVLSHVRCRHIRCLTQKEGKVEVSIPDGVYGQDSNFLLKTLLGSSYRPKDIEADIQRLFDLIRDDIDAARTLLEELMQKIEGESPELMRAESLLHRREVLHHRKVLAS
jgi:predicted ATP-binding protein involved in virulence